MTHYFDPEQTDSLACFASLLESMLKKHTSFHDLVLLCIGSDRATGDSLGPLLGHRLQQGRLLEKNGFHLYGTLEHPVHAKNLEATIRHIQFYHSAPLIIALDASLGRQEHIGYVTLRKGPLFPGVGVAKNLPPVGDICITGIVNFAGCKRPQLLQTTSLGLVVGLVDFIQNGLFLSLDSLQLRPPLQCAE